jgi:carbon storage regulator
MLVLSRKVGESIKIGEGITVVINRIAGNRVTLGLQAPRDMRIIRGELRPFDEDESTTARLRREKPVPIFSKTDPDLEVEVMTLEPRRAR